MLGNPTVAEFEGSHLSFVGVKVTDMAGIGDT
jgi:hypothetical protein